MSDWVAEPHLVPIELEPEFFAEPFDEALAADRVGVRIMDGLDPDVYAKLRDYLDNI